MDAGVLRRSIFVFLFWILFVPDTSIGQEPPSAEMWPSKTFIEDDETVIPYFATTQRDVAPGTIPTFDPTPTTPDANPTSPEPPSLTGPQQPPFSNQPTTNPTPGADMPQQPPFTNQPTTNPTPGGNMPATSGGSWCIANPTASQTALQVALDYACGYGGADCSAIQQGGPCYDPDTVKDHASYAFNDYYQKNPVPTSCVFGGTAQLSYTDPSNGNCHYASSRTETPTPPTIPMTPPSTTMPETPYAPSGPTGYGTEPTDYGPTGSPNSADIASYRLSLIMITCSLMLWLAAANQV